MMKKLSRNIFILETTLFVINFYFGIYSLFDMIPDKINIKLYHLLFRDDEKNTWKYPNYMEWACEYQMNPRYSILLTIVIFVFSILVVKHSRNEKGKKNSDHTYFFTDSSPITCYYFWRDILLSWWNGSWICIKAYCLQKIIRQ